MREGDEGEREEGEGDDACDGEHREGLGRVKDRRVDGRGGGRERRGRAASDGGRALFIVPEDASAEASQCPLHCAGSARSGGGGRGVPVGTGSKTVNMASPRPWIADKRSSIVQTSCFSLHIDRWRCGRYERIGTSGVECAVIVQAPIRHARMTDALGLNCQKVSHLQPHSVRNRQTRTQGCQL